MGGGKGITVCVVLSALGCSRPAEEEPRSTEIEDVDTGPQPERLWSFDLTVETTSRMTLEELWAVGVECRLWPAEIPDGLDRTEVLERLLDEKYRNVGHEAGDLLEEGGYSSD